MSCPTQQEVEKLAAEIGFNIGLAYTILAAREKEYVMICGCIITMCRVTSVSRGCEQHVLTPWTVPSSWSVA